MMKEYLCSKWDEQNGNKNNRYKKIIFKNLPVPQQDNTFDCGMFLLYFAMKIVQRPFNTFNDIAILTSSWPTKLPTDYMLKFRKFIRAKINHLKKKLKSQKSSPTRRGR